MKASGVLRLNFQDTSSSQIASLRFNQSPWRLSLYDDSNNERFTLLTQGGSTQGRVGIGTAAPAALLHVDKTALTVDTVNEITRIQGSAATTNTHLIVSSAVSGSTVANRYIDLSAFDHNPTARALSLQKAGGNVGIGRTIPSTKLVIQGVYDASATPSAVSGNTANKGLEIISEKDGSWGTGNTYGIDFGASSDLDATSHYKVAAIYAAVESVPYQVAGKLGFYTTTGGNGSTLEERLSIQGDGNVGIGTTAPAAPFHVHKDSSTAVRLVRGATDGQVLQFYRGASAAGNVSVRSSGLAFGGGTSEDDIFIDTAGKVGINDITPGYQLDVNGTFRVTGAATFDSSIGFTTVLAGNGSAGAPSFAFTSDTNTGIYRVGENVIGFAVAATSIMSLNLTNLQPSTATVDLGTTGNRWRDLYISNDITLAYDSAIGTDPSGGSHAIVFADNPYNIFYNSVSGHWFNLDSNAVGLTGDFVIGKDRTGSTGGTTYFTLLESTGNVGIGTAVPKQKLHIFQTEGGVGVKHATIRLGGYQDKGAEIAAYRTASNSNNMGLRFSAHNVTNGIVDVMTLDDAGHVGIGTTAPAKALHIGNAANVTGNGNH